MRTVKRRPRNRHANVLQRRVTKFVGDLLEQPGEPTVIGLDASLTKYGACILGVESKAHATMVFKPKRKGVQRLFEIYEFVQTLALTAEHHGEIQHIVMEDYAPGSHGTQKHAIGEGGGISKFALVHLFGVEDEVAYPTLIRPNSLKKFVTGAGNAEKDTIMLRVFQKWGVELAENNQADAYALARVALAIHSGETEYGYEADTIRSLERSTEWPKP